MPTHTTLLRGSLLGLVAIVSLLATGCTRSVTTTTTVKSNGAFTRKIVFQASGDGKNATTGEAALRSEFEMPAGGPWKITRKKSKDESVYTAERALTPGSVQKQDLAFKSSDPSKPGLVFSNEATVRSAGSGKWEYHEILHWTGRTPDFMALVRADPRIMQTIKASLPPSAATDANVHQIAFTLSKEMWRALFGRWDLSLTGQFQMNDHPEVFDKKIVAQISPALYKALAAQSGDKLTAEQRRVCVRKILGIVVEDLNPKTQTSSTQTAPIQDFGDVAMVPLTFSVKLPGKIVSTNGTRSAVKGEVLWSLFPQAAALGDVELTAACDTHR